MAEKKSKMVYETVGISDLRARQQEIQAAREENARIVQQKEEELRQLREREISLGLEEVRLQNLVDAIAEAETERREENLRQQKEQEEKIAFLKRKQELLEYKFGNKLSLETFEAEGVDVSDMKKVRIAVFGTPGAGRTSFIGTAERTLLGPDTQTAFGSGDGKEDTIILQEYLSALNFSLLDTRGFWNIEDDNNVTECQNIMTGKTRESDVIVRNYDNSELGESADVSARSMAKFGDQAHAVIFMFKANDLRLKGGEYSNSMMKFRHYFRSEGHSPVTVVTHEDALRTEEDRQIAFQEASAATGSPIDRTFFITNYTSQNNDYSFETEKQVLYIIDAALLSAERFVKIQKLREGATNETLVRRFFKGLQAKYNFPDDKVTAIIKQLEDNEIKTVYLLKASWEEMKKDLKMPIGIRKAAELALANIN